jgi:NAD-dependent dihydropyrimidine dehydrogenase PreA subunit
LGAESIPPSASGQCHKGIQATHMDFFKSDRDRHSALATAWVTPEPSRCVQCGMCTFHCPMGIDVRRHVWLGEPVKDSHCLACSECVKRCPRGLLRLEPVMPAGLLGAEKAL